MEWVRDFNVFCEGVLKKNNATTNLARYFINTDMEVPTRHQA